MNLTYEQYQILFWVLLALTIAAAVVTVYLFFNFKVIEIISDLSGRSQRKEVERLKSEQAESIELSSAELKMRKKATKANTTGFLDKSTSVRLDEKKSERQSQKAQVLDSGVQDKLSKVQSGSASSKELEDALLQAESEKLSNSAELAKNANAEKTELDITNEVAPEESEAIFEEFDEKAEKSKKAKKSKKTKKTKEANASDSSESAKITDKAVSDSAETALLSPELKPDFLKSDDEKLSEKAEKVEDKSDKSNSESIANNSPSIESANIESTTSVSETPTINSDSAETALLSPDKMPKVFKNVVNFDDADTIKTFNKNTGVASNIPPVSIEPSFVQSEFAEQSQSENTLVNAFENHASVETTALTPDIRQAMESKRAQATFVPIDTNMQNINTQNNVQTAGVTAGETAKLDISQLNQSTAQEQVTTYEDWFTVENHINLGSTSDPID